MSRTEEFAGAKLVSSLPTKARAVSASPGAKENSGADPHKPLKGAEHVIALRVFARSRLIGVSPESLAPRRPPQTFDIGSAQVLT